MRARPGTERAPRMGVIDLGSNSVRLVVYEGRGRNPTPIFNEKAILGLGRGLETTGRLNEEAVENSLTVLERYAAVSLAMRAEPTEILATAAVRDAANGPAFVAELHRRFRHLPIRVLSGEEEARISARGVLAGIPSADGIMGDLGGGSLEVVELRRGETGASATLPCGVIRLAEQAGGSVTRTRSVMDRHLAHVPWLERGSGRDLYLVGGAWRTLAQIHIAQTDYPLSVVHHYALGRDEARDLAGIVAGMTRKDLERMMERAPGISRRRLDALPFAAVVLRRLLRATGSRRVVFSANGLREGWYMAQIAPETRALDPVLAAGQDLARRFSRQLDLAAGLVEWTAPIFPGESEHARKLREAACWLSDIGAHEHPEYRAEQAYFHVLRLPGVGLDHHARAFLALVVGTRYEADAKAPYAQAARTLLDPASLQRAETLGIALRLAYTLSGGTAELLALTGLRVEREKLVLRLAARGGVFAGESVWRRLSRLAGVFGLEPSTEIAADAVLIC